MSLKKHLKGFLIILILSIFLVPTCIYFSGLIIIGPYESGGLMTFIGEFWLHALSFNLSAMTLLLAPYLLWRLLKVYNSFHE